MIVKVKLFVGFAALILSLSQVTVAQAPKQNPPPPPTQNKDTDKTPVTEPLTLDKGTAPAPVSAEEDAAYKAFIAIPVSDTQNKITSGEAFLQKYPQSRYRAAVYPPLIVAYVQAGQVEKMETVGDQAIELTPADLGTLAIVASTLPRAINSKTVDPDKKLAKAERYAKQAIE